MDGRNDDVDTDVSNPFFTITSPSGYSGASNFTPSLTHHSLIDDDVFGFRHPAATSSSSSPPSTTASASCGYQNAPKVFDRFESSSSSSDENDEFYNSDARSGAVQKRLDYMMEFLDRKLSMTSSQDSVAVSRYQAQKDSHQPLPEFIGSGGGTGIFKLPVRCAVEPNQPHSLELRPQPLRETQIGRFLRNIICVDNGRQLWAGSECGIRVWNLANMYDAAQVLVEEEGEPGRFSEEDTAPFVESASTAATLCLVGDDANRLVWSGHKDGRIRCWKMDEVSKSGFKEKLSWQAHRGPVLSMIMTSYGDLWSGSEGGSIIIWPWEAVDKALSLTSEEKHMAALLLQRSFIDMRSQVSLNGACNNVFSSDIKFLLCDHAGGKVWSAGYLSFALWDARTRELLKLFNTDGQIENLSTIQDPIMEEDVRVRIGSVFKKDKPQTSIGFFQRSRNALLGAADAVRRAAIKGAFGEDSRRIEALIGTIDGMIWTGSANGLLVHWDGDGNRLQDFQYHLSAVQSLCAFGPRIWVAYASGTMQVLDLCGNLLGSWVVNRHPVIDLAIGSGYIFTLASHGGIRGWSITSPGPVDGILCSELGGKDFLYTEVKNLKILAGTWNVGQGRSAYDSLILWLGSAAADVDIVVVGLQEVEMGAGFLAVSAARETVGLEGSSLGQWWLDMIGKTLDEESTFLRVGSRQLAGLLIAAWIRSSIKGHVGDIDVAAVPCGFGRAIGNKGAVGLRMTVYSRKICFVNCHFAAHLEGTNRRNADFDHVYRNMAFTRSSNAFNAAPGVSSAVQMPNNQNALSVNSVEGTPELTDADLVVFLGDFNYRLDNISYDEARDFISQRCFDWLRERDQLKAEMEAGNAFQGMREAVIKFPPTYKFERHQAGLAGYDSGEKKRIPAWCDRILYRDSRLAPVSPCSLECPVVSSVLLYDACMDITDSDHKPVRCIFSVEIARVDESLRRQEFGEVIHSNPKFKVIWDKLSRVPEAIVSTNNIILQNLDVSILRITNKSGNDAAFFEIICEGQSIIKDYGQAFEHHPRGSFGFPRWLKVRPAAGIINPDHITEISIYHEEYETLEEFVDGSPQNSWCEDARDKEVILVVNVRGSYSTEARNHRVRVRHSFSGKIVPRKEKPKVADHLPANLLLRSDLQRLSDTSDVVDHLRNLHSP